MRPALARVLAHLAVPLALVVSFAPGGAPSAQPAGDAAALVGEWPGTRSRWTADMGQPERIQWGLVIERVEGDKVYLRREMPGARDTSFVGTLVGNQLNIGQGASAISFTIDGGRMTSKFRAPNGMVFEYDLRKK